MQRRRDGWRVQWRSNGKRFSRDFESKKEAQTFERELKAGLVQGLSSLGAEPALTFRDYSTTWMESYCKVEKAESQHVHDESTLRVHILPFFGDMALRAITEREVASFKELLKSKTHPKSKRPLKPKTINHVLALLKQILSHAVADHLIPVSPAQRLRPVKNPQRAPAYWTAEEREKFYRFVRHEDPEFARLCYVAALTGLRRGELAALTAGQIEWSSGHLRIDAAYCFKTRARYERTKNGEIGYVPMLDAVKAQLAHMRLASSETPVFPIETFQHAAQRLQRLARKVGVKPIRFHDLRHTCGSNMVSAGASLYEVQRALRHKTPTMTQRYAHLSDEALRRAFQLLVAPTAGTQKPDSENTPSNIQAILEP